MTTQDTSQPRQFKNGFKLVCLPDARLECADCDGPVETVHVEADGKHYCTDPIMGCVGEGDIGPYADLAEAMNALDRALASIHPLNRADMLQDVQDFTRDIGRYHVPEGTGKPGDDVTFALELIDRAGKADVDPQLLAALIRELCPGVTIDALDLAVREEQEGAMIRQARWESARPGLDAMMLLFSFSNVDKSMTMQEAMGQLGLDAAAVQRFVDLVTTQAAALGKAVPDLPPDVARECLAQAKADRV